MTEPKRHGARDDGTRTRELRIEMLRAVHCDGMQVAAACRKFGVSKTSYYAWAKVTPEVDEAKALGPTGAAPEAPGGDPDDPFGALPPIGEERPDDPSPEFMGILAHAYGLHGDPARLDRLAAWPAGSVQAWFDRAQRGDRACAIRVAQLQRAQELVTLRAMVALTESGNPVALTKFLAGRGAMVDTPPEPKNAAEGFTREQIERELVRRAIEAGRGS